jgi:hypothetical protein
MAGVWKNHGRGWAESMVGGTLSKKATANLEHYVNELIKENIGALSGMNFIPDPHVIDTQ